jgi:hypothetical protein
MDIPFSLSLYLHVAITAMSHQNLGFSKKGYVVLLEGTGKEKIKSDVSEYRDHKKIQCP